MALATSQDGARKRKEATMKCYPRPRPETTSEEFLALLILLGPLAFVVRWLWRGMAQFTRCSTHQRSNSSKDMIAVKSLSGLTGYSAVDR